MNACGRYLDFRQQIASLHSLDDQTTKLFQPDTIWT
jgi:hypothetical protein